jgi:ABC-2 type transport system permease protein
VVALTLANLKMMSRNRQAAFWALFFPLMLVVVFGLIDINAVGPGEMWVLDQSASLVSQQIRNDLEAINLLNVGEHGGEEAQARAAVARGDVDYLLIIPQGIDDPSILQDPARRLRVRLLYGSANPGRNQLVDGTVRNIVARVLAETPGVAHLGLIESEEVPVVQVSYFDGVLMGLVGLGIMTNSIISIAVRISTYRNSSILKRLLVTPLPIWKYFVGEVAAHLVLALIQAAIILAVGVFVFGARIHGNAPVNVLGILGIAALGSLVFLNIGFIVSAWSRTPAAASGMGNAIALPMMFFAGTFFSTAALPSVLPFLAEALPLTPMLVAMREVANAGQPLWTTWPQLAILGGWVLATGAVATRVFKFH